MRRKARCLLLALLTVDQPLYALDLARISGISAGSLYVLLTRWETAGHLSSEWAPGPAPRRRYYQLTPDGREWARAQVGLPPRWPWITIGALDHPEETR